MSKKHKKKKKQKQSAGKGGSASRKGSSAGKKSLPKAVKPEATIAEPLAETLAPSPESMLPPSLEKGSVLEGKQSRADVQGQSSAPISERVAPTEPSFGEKDEISLARNIEGELLFQKSLVSAKAVDLGPKQRKKPADLLGKALTGIVFLACLSVFLYSAYIVIFNLITYKIADDRYQQLADNFAMDSEGSITTQLYSTGDHVALPTFSQMLSGDFTYKEVADQEELLKLALYRSKLQMLKEQNEDTYGWISIEGTNIEYPLVQGADNDFYLDHDFSKAYYTVGSIFVDWRCSDTITQNRNTVIYGHNIRTRGIMFNQLLRYMDKAFFDEHPYITIYTLDGVYTYEIVSFFQTPADSGYTAMGFSGDEAFVKYCRTMYQNSWHQREGSNLSDFTPETRTLLLSTCTNGDSSERFAVFARLVKSVES